jgi:hypothetical protein
MANPATVTENGARFSYMAERKPAATLSATLTGWITQHLGLSATGALTTADVSWTEPEQSFEFQDGIIIQRSYRSGTSEATLSQFSARGVVRLGGDRRVGGEVSAGVQYNNYSGYNEAAVTSDLLGPVAGSHLYYSLANQMRLGIGVSYATFALGSDQERQHDLALTAAVTVLLSPDNEK